MELDKAIQSRKSVRKFSKKKPDWRQIIEAIDSSRYAPRAGNNFSLKFILVDDEDKIEKLAKASQQDFISNAQYVVVVCSEESRVKNAYPEFAEKFLRQQAGAAIENFLLKIQEAGLATCWVGWFVEEQIKKILDIPESQTVEAIFPIGYEDKNIKSREKGKANIDAILFFNKYGKKRMND